MHLIKLYSSFPPFLFPSNSAFLFCHPGALLYWECCLTRSLRLTQAWPRFCLGNYSLVGIPHSSLQFRTHISLTFTPMFLLLLPLTLQFAQLICGSDLFVSLFMLCLLSEIQCLLGSTHFPLLIGWYTEQSTEVYCLFANDALLSLERNRCFESTAMSSHTFA